MIKKGIYYLIPGNIEKSINYTKKSNNLVYDDIYLNIKHHRNYLYITGVCSSILYLYDWNTVGSICLFIQLGIYLYVIKSWNDYI